jgi:multidrug efflux system outer membrane protein
VAAENAGSDAKRSAGIALSRHQADLFSYLNVVVGQQTLLTNQQTVVQVNEPHAVATVALVPALGGGWKGLAPDTTNGTQHP